MSRKHFEMFGCEEKRVWRELKKNIRLQKGIFMVVVIIFQTEQTWRCWNVNEKYLWKGRS